MKHSEVFFNQHMTLIKRRYKVHQRVKCNPFDGVPFIDVVLLIIIFLIINSSFVVRPGIRLSLPQSSQEQGIPYSSLVITISRENTIFFDNELVTLEELPSAFLRMKHEKADHSLIIEADASVDSGFLVKLYNLAIGAGITEVVLATDITRIPEEAP